MASWARGFSRNTKDESFFVSVIQHNKGATSAQEIITTSTLNDYFPTQTQRVQRVQNNNDAFVEQSCLRWMCFEYLLFHHTSERTSGRWRGSLDHSRDCKQYLNNSLLNKIKGLGNHGICNYRTVNLEAVFVCAVQYQLSDSRLSSPSRSGIIQAHESDFSSSRGFILLWRTTSVVWLRAPGWNNKKCRTRAGAISVLCAMHKNKKNMQPVRCCKISPFFIGNRDRDAWSKTDHLLSYINDQPWIWVVMGYKSPLIIYCGHFDNTM